MNRSDEFAWICDCSAWNRSEEQRCKQCGEPKPPPPPDVVRDQLERITDDDSSDGTKAV